LTKHVGFVYAYHVKKAKYRKINDEKSGDKQKSRLIIDNEKQDTFQFVRA